MGTIGDMTLIDTPGFNDPDIAVSDKNIYIEIVKSLSSTLYDPTQGISSFILCVMPNESQRIRDSTINAMNNMLFMLNSLDERTDISLHPKFKIIFNNVSRHGDSYDPETIGEDLDYDPERTVLQFSI